MRLGGEAELLGWRPKALGCGNELPEGARISCV